MERGAAGLKLLLADPDELSAFSPFEIVRFTITVVAGPIVVLTSVAAFCFVSELAAVVAFFPGQLVAGLVWPGPISFSLPLPLLF